VQILPAWYKPADPGAWGSMTVLTVNMNSIAVTFRFAMAAPVQTGIVLLPHNAGAVIVCNLLYFFRAVASLRLVGILVVAPEPAGLTWDKDIKL